MEPCEHEPEILQALTNGRWNEHLQQHANTCDSCRLTAALSSAMRELSRPDNITHSLPHYRWIMAQALMQKESTTQKKLQRVSAMAATGTIVVSVIIVSALFSSQGYSVFSIFKHLARPDVSVVWIAAALWLVSEFQLKILFKIK